MILETEARYWAEAREKALRDEATLLLVYPWLLGLLRFYLAPAFEDVRDARALVVGAAERLPEISWVRVATEPAVFVGSEGRV